MEVKERIIEKAGDLFYQYGIKNTSMDELASSLGISKRTIYENFRDKEGILLSLLIKLREERDKHFSVFLSEKYNVVEIFIKIIEIQQATPPGNVKFFKDIHKYYPRAARLMQEDINKNNAFLRSFLRNGIEQGFIRKDLNVDVAAFLVEESTYTYVRASYLEKPPFSFPELFYTMMINFVRGISTEKGIRIIDRYLEKQKKENNKQ
ncbi:MAG: TetR/AcrR family transcriptional regulator [Proteiniphilum sp.]|jgi:AcrR family transcriptional regulator|nr:TetR/AcrR family transcriptional regulator [Proteiniphilum sp.]